MKLFDVKLCNTVDNIIIKRCIFKHNEWWDDTFECLKKSHKTGSDVCAVLQTKNKQKKKPTSIQCNKTVD